ncbi:hypothetical protein PV797_20750 [Clostridiaceae bacterium M8S5]|nr:hypothetical protein PV797_20750 [Clostridiaceae bacterium M8S5]
MQINNITCFNDFCSELRKAGFSLGGSIDEGIFALSSYYGDNIESHTDDEETDPWKWRIRSIMECGDIAYGKLFFNKGGWITKEWYPYFLAVRRGGESFDKCYGDGKISNIAKKVYKIICSNPNIALHEIKSHFNKDESKKLSTALTTLQMKMFITISGQKYKISKEGREYGWPVTTFVRVEEFFEEEVFTKANNINESEAIDKIKKRILELNSKAQEKVIKKFLYKR